MRRLLIYNYWLIIIAWCSFLNDLSLLAIILCLGACALLLKINKEVNYWRMSFLSVISYVTISFFLSMSNIPYFFPKLYFFIAIICLDLALTFERLYLLKSKYLYPFLIVMAICVSVLSLVVLLLPNSLYTLFSKNSLFAMLSLIFLPYIVPLAYIIVYRQLSKTFKKYLQCYGKAYRIYVNSK